MKNEEIFYHKTLFALGISQNYHQWLDYYTKNEDPLSDIILELSFCSSDTEKTISVLNDYCLDHNYDKSAVCDMFRLFFKEEYYSKRMDKAEVVSWMYRLYLILVNESRDFYDSELENMFCLDEYYSMAQDGIITWENYDTVFFDYLDNGKPVDSNIIWGKNSKNH